MRTFDSRNLSSLKKNLICYTVCSSCVFDGRQKFTHVFIVLFYFFLLAVMDSSGLVHSCITQVVEHNTPKYTAEYFTSSLYDNLSLLGIAKCGMSDIHLSPLLGVCTVHVVASYQFDYQVYRCL